MSLIQGYGYCELSNKSDVDKLVAFNENIIDPPQDVSVATIKKSAMMYIHSGRDRFVSQRRVRLSCPEQNLEYHLLPITEASKHTRVLIVVTVADYDKHFPANLLLTEFNKALSNSGWKLQHAAIQSWYAHYHQSMLQTVEIKVNEVKEVMTKNIEKGLVNLDTMKAMEEKANELEDEAQKINDGSKRVKRMFCCRYVKTSILIGLIIALLIAGVITAIVLSTKSSK
jgi:hypothetical protein